VVMNRQSELTIVDEIGRERERYGLQYGAKLHFRGRRPRQGWRAARRVGPVLDADRDRVAAS